jgi:hypothetical protein
MISRLIGAFFSPLRDPFYKDWIFYVFIFFTITSISSNPDGSLSDYILLVTLIVGINWFIFIFGLSWIRSFGLNKYTIGIAPRFKSASSLNFPILDQNNVKVEYSDIQELIKIFGLKPGEKMEYLSSRNNNKSLVDNPDFKNWTESVFIWDMIFKPGELTPMIYGPIWFSCSEVKQKVPANLCLMTTGEIGITWRKHTNSLLDYWLTHISEISGFRLIDKFTLQLEVRTVNRVVGQVSGLRKAEIGTLELRVGNDGHANRRSVTAFYSFIANLN